MDLKELLELIGIDEPDEFEYFENFADIVESDEEIPEETLADLFHHTDPETVSEIIEQYFDDLMNAVTHEYAGLYALLDTIKNVLCALMLSDDDDNSIEMFAEELHKFHTWYSFESAVEVTEMGDDSSHVRTIKEAITIMRIGRLDNEDHVFDFSGCLDYEIEDYVLDLASESRDRRMDDSGDEFEDNGFGYDDTYRI